jgi:hypothetical protein
MTVLSKTATHRPLWALSASVSRPSSDAQGCNVATLQTCDYPPRVFRTNRPVTNEAFFDREKELGRLLQLTSDLGAGAPSWLAILGPRKIGKTSLILECARRSADKSIVIVSSRPGTVMAAARRG